MRRREVRFGAGLGALLLGLSSIGMGVVASLPAAASENSGAPSVEPSGEPSPSASPSASPTASSSAAPTNTPAPSLDATPTDEPGHVRQVDDAVFTWAINQQSNAQSHNPITDNFLAAGSANPGRGGMVLTESRWKAQAGNVEIQKVDAAGQWRRATWAGLGTDAAGKKIGLYGPFSGHRVRIEGGTGTVDPVNEDASVQWKGTFTVIYYGGNTVFTLTDPAITVTDGVGRLTATGGGWASDRFDPTVWEPVAPTEVPVVELKGVDVTETGFVVTPGYKGVRVKGPEVQVDEGEYWGAYPQEFVTFLEPTGGAQFWYSTGLQSDWTKLPEPVAVGWAGAEPEVPPTDRPKASAKPKPTNPVVTPPPSSVPTPAPSAAPTLAPSAPPISVPLPSSVPQGPSAPETSFPLVTPVSSVTGDHRALPATTPVSSPLGVQASGWFGGGGLLLAAALTILLPTAPRRT